MRIKTQFRFQVVSHEYCIASVYKGFSLLLLQKLFLIQMEFQFTAAGQSSALKEEREFFKLFLVI